MRRLYRSRTDRRIAGICGGLAEVYSIDPTLLRLGCVFLCLLTGILPVPVTYIVAWIIVPEGPPSTGDEGKPDRG